MRKNTSLRVAAILLALTLITSCFVGGTFAKYITGEDVTASARVAHWGFNATDSQATFINLFKDSGTGTLSSNEDNVIAPGTTNEVEFTVVNADATTNPEVAFKVTVNTTGTTAALSTDLEDALTFTLDGDDYATWDALVTAIKELSGEADGEAEYAAGSAVPAALVNGETHTIGWAWEFERTDKDATDTAMGNKAIAELEKLTLAIKITVEQLDADPVVTP